MPSKQNHSVAVILILAVLEPGCIARSELDVPSSGDGAGIGTGDTTGNGTGGSPGDSTGDGTGDSTMVAAPSIAITVPNGGSDFLTNESPQTLVGNCSADTVEVTTTLGVVDDGDCSDGTWSLEPFDLSEGDNQFTVTARNAAGATESSSMTIVYDSISPTGGFTSPNGGQNQGTTTQTLLVAGNCDADVVSVSSSLQTLYDADCSDGDWSAGNIDLDPGINTIAITFSDAAGNESTAEIVIFQIDPRVRLRSVSPGATVSLHDGSLGNLTVSDYTARFDNSLRVEVGVGDVIAYAPTGTGTPDALAFVASRLSDTELAIVDAGGNMPGPATDISNWSIYRAYTSLASALTQEENPGISVVSPDFDNDRDLVNQDAIWRIACYANGPDTQPASMGGWVTATNNYVEIFTPTSPYEVGVSQRHQGSWDTNAYRLEVANADALYISDDHVRIDGVQAWVTAVDSDNQKGFEFNGACGTGTCEFFVSNNIVRGAGSVGRIWHSGIVFYTFLGDGNARVWNNVVYDFYKVDDTNCVGIETYVGGGWTFDIYNNTLYNNGCGIGDGEEPHQGGDILAINNLAYNNYANYCADRQWLAGSSNNLSGPLDLADAPGDAAQDGATVSFVDAAAGDFHLAQSDTAALDGGIAVDAGFNDDVDGDLRADPWDIGADEAM